MWTFGADFCFGDGTLQNDVVFFLSKDGKRRERYNATALKAYIKSPAKS